MGRVCRSKKAGGEGGGSHFMHSRKSKTMEGEILGGGEITVMHARSLSDHRPRIPAISAQSTLGFHRPRRHRLSAMASVCRRNVTCGGGRGGQLAFKSCRYILQTSFTYVYNSKYNTVLWYCVSKTTNGSYPTISNQFQAVSLRVVQLQLQVVTLPKR